MRRRIPIRETADYWREPTLDEILSDPIAEAVMRADSVDRNALDAMLRDIAQHVQASQLTRLAAGRRGGQQADTIYPRYGA